MLIVFFGCIIIGWNSIIKINVSVLEGRVRLKYILKHFGIIILVTIAAAAILLLAAKFLPASFRF